MPLTHPVQEKESNCRSCQSNKRQPTVINNFNKNAAMTWSHTRHTKTHLNCASAARRGRTRIPTSSTPMTSGNIMKSLKEHSLTTFAAHNDKRLQKHKNRNNLPHSRKLTTNCVSGDGRRWSDIKGELRLQLKKVSGSKCSENLKGNGMWQLCEIYGQRDKVLKRQMVLFRDVRMGKHKNIVETMENKESKELRSATYTTNQVSSYTIPRNQTKPVLQRCSFAEYTTCLKHPVQTRLQRYSTKRQCFRRTQPHTPQTQCQNQETLSQRLENSKNFLSTRRSFILKHLGKTSQQYRNHGQRCQQYTNKTIEQAELIKLSGNVQHRNQKLLKDNESFSHQTKQDLENEFKSQKQMPNYVKLQQRTCNNNKKPKLTLINSIPNTNSPQNDWLIHGMRIQLEQRCHVRTSTSTASYHFNSFNNLFHSQFLLFSTLLFLLSIIPHLTQAACRNTTARPCEAICSTDGRNCTLRALVLLPDNDTYLASMRSSMPVLHLAEEYIRENSLLPEQLNFEWMTDDVKCDASYATIKAMDGISKNCAHVVFGPVCDYALAAVSRIAKYFNSNGTPVISVGGATHDFELPKKTCTDQFYMLLRSGLLSFKTIAVMTVALLKRYNWSNPIAIFDPNSREDVVGESSCYLMMKSFGAEMRNLNLTFGHYTLTPQLRNHTEELKREIGNKHTSKWNI